MRNLWSILVLVLFWGCKHSENKPIIQPLDNHWQFTSKNDSVWHSASVPGNIFTDLLAHHIIDDPFIKENEAKVQWVSDSAWKYKTTFQIDKKTLLKNNHELNFEGLDTYAKVYLNEHLILSSNNAFRHYKIPVKTILKEENKLQIEFESTAVSEEREKKKLGYQLPEGNRVFTRKAQFQYGWDWGPKLNTAGIWKAISLKSWEDILIKDIYIKQQSLSKENASLIAQITISSDIAVSAEIKMSVNGKYIKKPIQLKKGTQVYEIPISISNPILWWPHNLGTPHLYSLHFELFSEGKLIEEKLVKHGVRTIALVTEKDTIGTSFYFKVNGVNVYAKGANYIPQNSFQNKVTARHYKKLLSDVVASNMNMLRVWGGGIYENDIFYELCDEKGILVWQDFMFACAMYPGDTAFLTTIQQEAIDQVKRLRNHPSIALWAGNNESSEGWKRWGWQDGRTEEEKKEIWRNYLTVFDSILPNVVTALSATSYWETSPKYGRGNPNYKKEGDAHDWWVWHDAYPFEHFETHVPRFMSEFGFQSFPSAAVINFINQEETIRIHTDAIKSHQKHVRGFQLIDEYMKRDYPVPTNDEEYVYISQLLQAKGITMGIEAQRRAKPYNMGSLFWQLNDCWPSISWSSIDYFGHWKALQYKAKKAFNNVLISTQKTSTGYEVHIVNDALMDIQGTLQLKIIDFNGKELWSYAQEVISKANSSQNVYKIPNTKLTKANLVSIMEFNAVKSYTYFARPKDLKLLKGTIEKRIKKTKNGFFVTLKSAVLQKDVFLSSEAKGHFSDNFFDLMPNETKTLFFESEANSLADLKIKSLNEITF